VIVRSRELNSSPDWDSDLRAKSRFKIEASRHSTIEQRIPTHHVLRSVAELLQAASAGSCKEQFAPCFPRACVLAAPAGTMLLYNFSGAVPHRQHPGIDTARGLAEIHRPAADADPGQSEGGP